MSHTVHAKKPITVPSTTCGYIPMTGQSDAGSVDAHISRIWPYDGEAAYRGTLTVRLTTTDYDVAKPSTRPMRLGGGLERVLVTILSGSPPSPSSCGGGVRARSRNGPIRRRERGYILTTDQSDAGDWSHALRAAVIGHMRCGLPGLVTCAVAAGIGHMRCGLL
eukprot:1184270-Prorocentrum_minimum.AAC.2